MNTLPVRSLLDGQRHQLLAHPFFRKSHSRDELVKLAFHQYSDSILWVPMLSLMRSNATSPRLRRAIGENIAHETGLDGPSHIALARDMLRSLGVRSLRALPTSTFAKSATLWLSDDFVHFGDAEIAGWLLTAETLVPLFFALVRDALADIGCDTAYFDAHIAVDGDEHSQWMEESVSEILSADAAKIVDVERGMKDASDEVVEVLR